MIIDLVSKFKLALILFSFAGTVNAVQVDNWLELGEVIDGDTIKATIQSLPRPLSSVSIRLRGIDTAEIRSKCPQAKFLAQQAKEFVDQSLKTAKSIKLENLSWDKYGGRILADVVIDNQSLSQLLVNHKLAIYYFGTKKNFDWCIQLP